MGDMSFLIYVPVIINMILAVCAVCGAYAAVSGVNAWRKQAEWNDSRILAKAILLGIFKMKHAVSDVRYGVMFTTEYDPAKNSEFSKKEFEYRDLVSQYKKRWEKITAAEKELYPILTESEVVWGNDLKNLMAPFNEHIFNLNIIVSKYLRTQNPENSKNGEEFMDIDDRKTLFESGRKDDVFLNELSDHIAKIEDYLKPKLGRRK